MNIGEKIKYFRAAHNMTQEQLAQEADISLNTLRKYESSERKPKPDQILKISHALGISINVFMDFDIHTVSDLLSLIFKMNDQLDLKFHSKKNADGTTQPESLTISFSNPLVNQKLASYVDFLEQSKNDNTDYNSHSLLELENQLLDDNTKINKGNIPPVLSTDATLSNLSDPSYQKIQSLLSDCTAQELEWILKSASLIKDCLRSK